MGGPGFDGATVKPDISDQVQSKITVSGSYTYIAVAPPGTKQSTRAWSVKRIDETNPNNVIILWAVNDGPKGDDKPTARFVHPATDLTVLTYA